MVGMREKKKKEKVRFAAYFKKETADGRVSVRKGGEKKKMNRRCSRR